MAKYRLLYLVADLRRVGPTNQTLNIICNANESLDGVLVLSLFDEPKDSLKDLYEKKGVQCKSLSLQRNNFIVAFVRLFQFLRKNEIELVHSYGVKPDVLLFFISKFFRIRYVLTQRCIPIEDYPLRMNKIVGVLIARIHTFVLKHSKNVVTCSKFLAKVMQEKYGCTNITPIQNGIDVNRFKRIHNDALAGQFDFLKGSVVFVSTGLFLDRKHNDEIIDAFIQANIDNAYLLMLGDGPLFDSIRNRYSEDKSILFLGNVPNVADYLSISDFFVSASDSEGLPNAVLEAIACGNPVILSDIPQHMEILRELPNVGRSFALHDKKAMAEIMLDFAKHKDGFADVAADLKESPFTMKKMGSKYQNYYRSLLNG